MYLHSNNMPLHETKAFVKFAICRDLGHNTLHMLLDTDCNTFHIQKPQNPIQ